MGTEVGDPISANNGSYHFSLPLLNLGGLIPLESRLTYHLSRAGAGENGFFHSLISILWRNPSVGILIDLGYSGDQLLFKSGSSGWTQRGAVRQYVLKETGPDPHAGWYYLLDPVAERVLVFEKLAASDYARLRAVMDRRGNHVLYDYSGTGTVPEVLYEGDGTPSHRRLKVASASIGGQTRVVSMTEQLYQSGAWQDGRRVGFGFEHVGAKDLVRTVTDPLGQETRFDWALVEGVWVYGITKVTLRNGSAPWSQTVAAARLDGEEWARVITQTDAYGNATTLAYDSGANRVTETRPDQQTVLYRHAWNFGPPESLGDASGNQVVCTATTANQVSSFRDRLGETTLITYHAQTGRPASVTNAKGGVTAYAYGAQTQLLTNPASPGETVEFTFHNLNRVDYPDQSRELFEYDAQGNPVSCTTRDGRIWRYQYNGKGQVTRLTRPNGGTVDSLYNADGTLASRQDFDTGTTTFSYDSHRRPVTITHPGGARHITYDLNDQLASITDERGNVYSFGYDPGGNLMRSTDPCGNSLLYTRDRMNRVSAITNRRGLTTTYAYDAMNRLAVITDPLTNATRLAYDPRGWLNRVTDAVGKVWQTDYDAEGQVISRTTPLNRTTRFGRDPLGRTVSITNPLGHATVLTRDAMGRVTAVADPLGRQTSYAYDLQGRLCRVVQPDSGQATYEYDSLGLLAAVRDLDDYAWTFAYTLSGRLQTLTDPLNRATRYAYGQRGWLHQVTYPDATTQTCTYDAAGNLLRRLYSNGPDLTFAYDDLNRLVATDGLSLAYNEVGQVVATTDPVADTVAGAEYDAAGRLLSVTYAGLFSVTYQYDPRGQLTGTRDSLTGTVIAFTYDDDGRLTSTRLPNGVGTTLTWDAASRLTRVQAGSLADLQYEYNAAGETIAQTCVLPLDPAASLAEGIARLTYDAAAQISSAGYVYDARGRLTAAPGFVFLWDGASRLVGYRSTVTAGDPGIRLDYNGLGDLLLRTEAGTTTRYLYNYALGLSPVVAERNDTTGQMQRYYVWTPAGRLLYMIDAAAANKVFSYHFDRIGSTLALTDGSGTVTDKYAYDPHGRLLAHEGGNSQPYTFVGQWGVRQEDAAGGMYQMRARYYHATTARFLSRDPVWPNLTDPSQLNPYQYARNSPVSLIDPSGRDTQSEMEQLVAQLSPEELGGIAGAMSMAEGFGANVDEAGVLKLLRKMVREKKAVDAEIEQLMARLTPAELADIGRATGMAEAFGARIDNASLLKTLRELAQEKEIEAEINRLIKELSPEELGDILACVGMATGFGATVDNARMLRLLRQIVGEKEAARKLELLAFLQKASPEELADFFRPLWLFASMFGRK